MKSRFGVATGWVALMLLCATMAAGADPAPVETGEEAAPESADEESQRTSVTATSLTQTMDADSGISVQTLCTNCNNADLSVGGMDNDHVSVTCDGLPVHSGLAQVYLLSVLPPTVIDKVSVKKGAGKAGLSGGAIGGGIEVQRRAPEPGLQVNASTDQGEYGWAGSRADVSGKVGVFSGSVVTSWATSDVVDANGDGNPNLASFDRFTVDGSAEFQLSRKHRIRVGGQDYDESQQDSPGAYDFLGSLFSGMVRFYREDVELERTQYDAFYEGEFGDGSNIEVSLLTSERSQDITEVETLIETYEIDEEHFDIGVSWSRPTGQQGMMRSGFSYAQGNFDVIDFNYNQGASLPPGFVLEDDTEEWGVWVEGEMAIGGNVELSAGLRYVAFVYEDNEKEVVSYRPERVNWLAQPLPDGDRLLPRAALTWKPATSVSLRFSAGAGFLAPTPIYDEVCCGKKYRNNRGMSAERSASYGIEATFQASPKFRLGTSLFVSDFDDRIVRLATLSNQFRATHQNANVPEARQTSLTVDSSWQATSRFTLKASASWLDADNRTPGNKIPVLIDFPGSVDPKTGLQVPVSKEFTVSKIPYTVERRAALGAQLSAPRRNVNVGVTLQYTGPTLIQRFVPLEEMIGNPDLNFSEVFFDSFISTEDFLVANLNFSKGFRNGMSLYGGVDNITDYVQSTLGDPEFDYYWGPLRGRYVYGGISYHYD